MTNKVETVTIPRIDPETRGGIAIRGVPPEPAPEATPEPPPEPAAEQTEPTATTAGKDDEQ